MYRHSTRCVYKQFAVAPRLLDSDYQVRGSLVERAELFAAAIAAGKKFIIDPHTTATIPIPFDTVEWCNIGNPQAVGQKPLTFPREVMSLVQSPHLDAFSRKMDTCEYSDEAIARAKEMVQRIGGWSKTGAYTTSKGYPFIRENVAEFIKQRDGYAVDSIDSIFLINGASSGIEMVLMALATENNGVLIPIPQYPLYSAVLTIVGSRRLGYELDESNNWSVDVGTLERKLKIARRDGVKVHAIVVINPGNPTGQILSLETMQQITSFCSQHDLLLLADEVYQDNVYHENRPFHSFYKVCCDMGDKAPSLISFHSTSKGFLGECGRRGGYMHLHNISPFFRSQLAKVASVRLCPNVDGQIMVDLLTKPPSKDTKAGVAYHNEYDELKSSLKRRALSLVEALNKFEGMQSNVIEGAMYAFPKIYLPPAYINHVVQQGLDEEKADGQWASELLDETGVVVVSGSGFGQVVGTHHFRTTILPEESRIPLIAEKIGAFHNKILARYGSKK